MRAVVLFVLMTGLICQAGNAQSYKEQKTE